MASADLVCSNGQTRSGDSVGFDHPMRDGVPMCSVELAGSGDPMGFADHLRSGDAMHSGDPHTGFCDPLNSCDLWRYDTMDFCISMGSGGLLGSGGPLGSGDRVTSGGTVGGDNPMGGVGPMDSGDPMGFGDRPTACAPPTRWPAATALVATRPWAAAITRKLLQW